MPSNEEKISRESLLCTNGLPLIIFLNNHDNPNLQEFFSKILPGLKKFGYKKFLCEGLPSSQLEIKYFKQELKTCLRDQGFMENLFRSQNLLDYYNTLNSASDKRAFCLSKGLPDEIAGRIAELPRLMSDLKFFKDIIISKLGFDMYGTESAIKTNQLFLKDAALNRSAINADTLSGRDALIAEELIKHQSAKQEEGGAVMYLGNGHFPGVCKQLLANKAPTSDYLFIDLMDSLSIKSSMTEQFLRYATLFKLVSISLDGSQEGKPDIAARKILSHDRLLPYTLAQDKTGTGKILALQMQAIVDENILGNLDRETRLNVQQNLILAKVTKDELSKIQAMQAHIRGYLSRRKTTPFLSQYKEAQKTLKAVESQEAQAQDQMMSAVQTKQYEMVIGLANQAKMCQENASVTKFQIQTLKEAVNRF